jgi:hypothetical protein
MTYWYISFATDDGFRGATVVAGSNPKSALANATLRGLNPGGEAAILEVLPEMEAESDMQAMINRLVGRNEMVERGAKRARDLPQEMQDIFDEEAEMVCADCNPPSRTK